MLWARPRIVSCLAIHKVKSDAKAVVRSGRRTNPVLHRSLQLDHTLLAAVGTGAVGRLKGIRQSHNTATHHVRTADSRFHLWPAIVKFPFTTEHHTAVALEPKSGATGVASVNCEEKLEAFFKQIRNAGLESFRIFR